MMAAVHPEDLELVARNAASGQAAGIPHENEMRVRRWDGSYRWHLGRASAVRNDEGQIVKWYGTCTDINDQQRAEDELEEAEAARAGT